MKGAIHAQSSRRVPPRNPKGGRPKQELAAQLGGHILDVALDQFVAHGFEGASTEKIAAAANVSKRTLYARFGSKGALVVASIEQYTSRELGLIEAAIPNGSLRKKIGYVARAMLDMSLQPDVVGVEALVYWLTKHRPGLVEAEPTIGAKVVIDVMQSVLQDAPEWRMSGAGDPAELARFLFDVLITVPRHRILRRYEMKNKAAAKAEYINQTLDLLASGLPLLRSPEGDDEGRRRQRQ